MINGFASLWDELGKLEIVHSCYASLPETAPEDYRKLASLLGAGGLLSAHGGSGPEAPAERTKVLGIGGGQGAGKSTLSELVASALEYVGHRVCVLSLDDFYLTRAERMALARDVHPLLETRGPPGTHDLSLLSDVIEELSFVVASEANVEPIARRQSCSIPVFDKAEDDRVGERVFEGAVDWILLEGWCVGARPLNRALVMEPVNALEAERDPDGVWRRTFADCLEREYAPLWQRFDAALFLRVPSLDAVRRWRLEQEQARPASRRLDAEAIARFVEHYERVTRSMWVQAPLPGQMTVTLGEGHEILDLGGQRAGQRAGQKAGHGTGRGGAVID